VIFLVRSRTVNIPEMWRGKFAAGIGAIFVAFRVRGAGSIGHGKSNLFCHSERSEESLFRFGTSRREIPRSTRNDKNRSAAATNSACATKKRKRARLERKAAAPVFWFLTVIFQAAERRPLVFPSQWPVRGRQSPSHQPNRLEGEFQSNPASRARCPSR